MKKKKTKNPKKLSLRGAMFQIEQLREEVERLEQKLEAETKSHHTDNLMAENIIRSLVTPENRYKLKVFVDTGPSCFNWSMGSRISDVGLRKFVDELYHAMKESTIVRSEEHRVAS